MMTAVSMARISLLVKQTLTTQPFSRSLQEAIVASARPRSLRGTSTQPVNLLTAFHRLCPWRVRISCAIAIPWGIADQITDFSINRLRQGLVMAG